MDQELVIAMQIYMRFPEACKAAAASGSKIAQHVQRIAAGMDSTMDQLQQGQTLADFDASKCVVRPR